MRITVDTNILISACFWKGDSFYIIKKVEDKEIELVLSEEILDELDEVLNSEEILKKVRDKRLRYNETILKISSIAAIVEPKRKVTIVKDDPEDNIIVECAIEGMG